MITFTVSEGSSRTAKVWKPAQYTWADFCHRLEETVRTGETAAQYAAATTAIKAGIKDKGGFVGGTLSGPERNKKTVQDRQLITLDADYPDTGFLDRLPKILYCAAALYTTHSHTPEKPRYRLIIPLDKPVSPEAYEAIARKVADDIGITCFDSSTFEPERLMFWPTTACDGEYIYKTYDGEPLNADIVLAQYEDWHDISSWPLAPKEKELTKRGEFAQDPLQKEGMIGAFCRTYTIPEVIDKYLPDIYVPAEGFSNRYTYTAGTGYAGLVLFDNDTLAISYHGTDPASTGHELNAFDLVRIHLFEDKDANCRETTPIEKRPSYKAMMELAGSDQTVCETLIRDKVTAAQEAFENVDAASKRPPEEDSSWLTKIRMDPRSGMARNTHQNIHYIMTNDPKMKGALAFNEFSSRVVILKPLPWHKQVKDTASGDPWTDTDTVKLERYLERYREHFTRQFILGQILDVSDTLRVHPVRDYLLRVEPTWDGVKRVDRLLIDRIGADPTEYTMAVTRKTLAAAVARIMTPGCKFDYVLTLTGAQGIGKSTLIEDLAHGWYSSSVYDIGSKEASISVQGYWIIEMSELAAVKKADQESIKSFISDTVDRYRPTFGRFMEDHPRQCVFIGTTNSDVFLRDETGGRRWWPVHPTGNYMANRLKPEEIDQIWAEAVQIWRAGEPLYLPQDLEQEANHIQATYRMEDPWTAEIQAYLDKPIPVDWYDWPDNDKHIWLSGVFSGSETVKTMARDTVTMREIWTECFGGQPRDLKKNMSALHQAMTGVKGWSRVPGRSWWYGRSVNVYRRDENVPMLDGKVIPFSSAQEGKRKEEKGSEKGS